MFKVELIKTRTSLSTFSQLLLDIYAMAQTVPIKDFQESVLILINKCLPFSSAMWGTATMTNGGIDIHTLHLHNTTMQMIHEYESVKHLDHFALETSKKEKATISFSAADARTPEHRAFLMKFGHVHGLITHELNPYTNFTQWLSLFRKDESAVCTMQELELLDNLFPHLTQALAINRKAYMETLIGDERRERWSVAIADKRGVLYHADIEFFKLLSADFTLVNATHLPNALITALTSNLKDYKCQHAIYSVSLEGDILFLKSRKRLPADSLSQREHEVAVMLASGLSLKEIALKLGRSPETIRTHVKSIYAKLGTKKVTLIPGFLSQRD